jgi:hypothetical protein
MQFGPGGAWMESRNRGLTRDMVRGSRSHTIQGENRKLLADLALFLAPSPPLWTDAFPSPFGWRGVNVMIQLCTVVECPTHNREASGLSPGVAALPLLGSLDFPIY